jgi:hypothetical protein
MFAAATLLLMAAPPRAEPPRPATSPAASPAATSTAAPAPAAVASPAIAGGYAAMERHTPELHAAFRAAVAAITPVRSPGARLIAAHRQVVAGTNYRMTIKLRDGSRWQATVWHRLDGQFQVTEVVRQD